MIFESAAKHCTSSKERHIKTMSSELMGIKTMCQGLVNQMPASTDGDSQES